MTRGQRGRVRGEQHAITTQRRSQQPSNARRPQHVHPPAPIALPEVGPNTWHSTYQVRELDGKSRADGGCEVRGVGTKTAKTGNLLGGSWANQTRLAGMALKHRHAAAPPPPAQQEPRNRGTHNVGRWTYPCQPHHTQLVAVLRA